MLLLLKLLLHGKLFPKFIMKNKISFQRINLFRSSITSSGKNCLNEMVESRDRRHQVFGDKRLGTLLYGSCGTKMTHQSF